MRLDEIIQQPGQKERILQKSVMEKLHVSAPGKVIRFNPDTQTVDVQLTIRSWGEEGDPPIVLDVPVVYQGIFTYSIAPGMECLVVFADDCIDGWYQNGTISNELINRNHSLSDGFAFVGVRSLPNVGPGINLDLMWLMFTEYRLSYLEVSVVYRDSDWTYIESDITPVPSFPFHMTFEERLTIIEERLLYIEENAVYREYTWTEIEGTTTETVDIADNIPERMMKIEKRMNDIEKNALMKSLAWGGI